MKNIITLIAIIFVGIFAAFANDIEPGLDNTSARGLDNGNDREIFNAGVLAPNGSAYFPMGNVCYQYDVKNSRLKAIRKMKTDVFLGVDSNVDAALMHPENKLVYLFKGNTYYGFDTKLGKLKFKRVVGQEYWKGLSGPFDAAISHPTNNCAYFFKGNTYQRFNYTKGEVDDSGIIGKDAWKGVGTNLDAAIMHSNGKAYLFKGDFYWRFDPKKRNVDRFEKIGDLEWKNLFPGMDAALESNGQPESVMRGSHSYVRNNSIGATGYIIYAPAPKLPNINNDESSLTQKYTKKRLGHDIYDGVPKNVDAVLRHTTDMKIYFFKGKKYYRYDAKSRKVDQIGTIGVDDWKGIPANLDAALVYGRNGKAYFFKGQNYYRYDFKARKRDELGIIGKNNWKGLPQHVDAAIGTKYGARFYKKSTEYVFSGVDRKVIKRHAIPTSFFK